MNKDLTFFSKTLVSTLGSIHSFIPYPLLGERMDNPICKCQAQFCKRLGEYVPPRFLWKKCPCFCRVQRTGPLKLAFCLFRAFSDAKRRNRMEVNSKPVWLVEQTSEFKYLKCGVVCSIYYIFIGTFCFGLME